VADEALEVVKPRVDGGRPLQVLVQSIALEQQAVTVRKDDAPATTQAAITNVAGVMPFSEGGGLIQTTSG